jgi:hypothetical protein
MLPCKAVVSASVRLLRLLRTSSVAHAWLILRTDSRYTDLTQSQYAAAIELLKCHGILTGSSLSLAIAKQFETLPEMQMHKFLFERIVRHAAPAWLADADVLIRDPADIPADAFSLATTLSLPEEQAFGAVQNAHIHVDLEKRKLIGDAGERALLAFLEERWSGTTVHVASMGDGFGYDIAFKPGQREWHLEVKSTVRRGRLTFYLSRNEYEVGLADPYWRLVVLGLNSSLQLRAIATLQPGHLELLAPVDSGPRGKWQSALFELSGNSFMNGIQLAEGPVGVAVLGETHQALPEFDEAWFEWLY